MSGLGADLGSDLPLAYKLWQQRHIPSEDLVDVATRALVEGADSPALRELAGVPKRFATQEAPDLALQALEELGLRPIPDEKAELALAQVYARRVVSGDLRPYSGASLIWRAFFPEYPSIAGPFIGLEDEWEGSPLQGLRALDLKLGGTRNLEFLPAVGELQCLELWMVKGLSDLSPVADLPALEYLFLQALRQVTALPSFHKLTRLTQIQIETMKGLSDLTPLLTAPALEQLMLVDMGHLKAADVGVLKDHPTLRAATIGLGSVKKNEAAVALLGLPRADRMSRHPALGP
jgi:hypothetical protein